MGILRAERPPQTLCVKWCLRKKWSYSWDCAEKQVLRSKENKVWPLPGVTFCSQPLEAAGLSLSHTLSQWQNPELCPWHLTFWTLEATLAKAMGSLPELSNLPHCLPVLTATPAVSRPAELRAFQQLGSSAKGSSLQHPPYRRAVV